MGNISLSAEPQAGELWLALQAPETGCAGWPWKHKHCTDHRDSSPLNIIFPELLPEHPDFAVDSSFSPLFKSVQVHFLVCLGYEDAKHCSTEKTPKTKLEGDLEIEQVSWLQCHPGEVPQLVIAEPGQCPGGRMGRGCTKDMQTSGAQEQLGSTCLVPVCKATAPKISTAL